MGGVGLEQEKWPQSVTFLFARHPPCFDCDLSKYHTKVNYGKVTEKPGKCMNIPCCSVEARKITRCTLTSKLDQNTDVEVTKVKSSVMFIFSASFSSQFCLKRQYPVLSSEKCIF